MIENFSQTEQTKSAECRLIDGSDIGSTIEKLIDNGADRGAINWLINGNSRHPGDEAMVAVVGESLIGMASLATGSELYPNEPGLEGIYVLPAFRRRGYGTSLVKSVLEHFQEQGYESVRVTIASRAMREVMASLPPEIKAKFRVIDNRSPENWFEYDN